jgi:hypothetical protein
VEQSWRDRFEVWLGSKPYNPITLLFHDKANSNLFRKQRFTQIVYVFLLYLLVCGGFELYLIYLTVKDESDWSFKQTDRKD